MTAISRDAASRVPIWESSERSVSGVVPTDEAASPFGLLLTSSSPAPPRQEEIDRNRSQRRDQAETSRQVAERPARPTTDPRRRDDGVSDRDRDRDRERARLPPAGVRLFQPQGTHRQGGVGVRSLSWAGARAGCATAFCGRPETTPPRLTTEASSTGTHNSQRPK